VLSISHSAVYPHKAHIYSDIFTSCPTCFSLSLNHLQSYKYRCIFQFLFEENFTTHLITLYTWRWFRDESQLVGYTITITSLILNLLKPNDPYMGRTAQLTSKRYILYIYSTNIGTEYFKHALYSPLFCLQNAVCFIILTCSVPVLFTFYIQGVLKLKKIIPAPKG